MNKFLKILLTIGGTIIGVFTLFFTNRKRFNKKVKANNVKLDIINKEDIKLKAEKVQTKAKISKTNKKIKTTKSQIKSTKNAKSTIDKFEKKYRK